MCGRCLLDATEAAAAACAYAVDPLGFSEIRAATDRPNVASAGVLARLGFVLDRVTAEGVDGTACYVRPGAGVEGEVEVEADAE